LTSNIKFGECLKFLLSTLDISSNKLSKAINVDSSLVNRWIHEKRIPAYTTTYIESISDYLSMNIHNTFQEKRLNEFFLNVYENSESANIDADSTKKKIKRALLEAQGYSIECNRKEQKEAKALSANKEKVSKVLDSEQPCCTKQNYNKAGDCIYNQGDTKDHVCSQKDFSHFVDLSSEDKIIVGFENILTASLSLLETAANQPCVNNNTIYITYIQDTNIENHSLDDLIYLRNALFKAINNGWNVLILMRLDSNTNRTIKFMNFFKNLIKMGSFNIYYMKKYNSLTLGKETIVVPELGVLSCFSTKSNSKVDGAFYFKNKVAIDVLKNYFNVLLETDAHPLIKYYSDENKIDYGDYLTQYEDEIGNRFLNKYSFSLLTMPENLYHKLLKRKKLSKDEMPIALEFYRKRLKSFHSNLQKYEYKDIYMIDSIKDLIKQRKFYFYSYKGVELMELEVWDVIEHMQNIIKLLKAYENYSIAFIPRDTDSTLNNYNCYCLVKERQAVLFEIFESSKHMPKMQMSIEEPIVVNAIYEYYRETWENIAPVNNEKAKVVAWLQDQINLLKKTIGENNG
jgi:hypothetical protein